MRMEVVHLPVGSRLTLAQSPEKLAHCRDRSTVLIGPGFAFVIGEAILETGLINRTRTPDLPAFPGICHIEEGGWTFEKSAVNQGLLNQEDLLWR